MTDDLRVRLEEDENGWTKLESIDPVTHGLNHPVEDWIRGYFNAEEHLREEGFEFRAHNMGEETRKFFGDILELRSPQKNRGYVFFTSFLRNIEACANSRTIVEENYACLTRHTIKSFSDSTIPLAGIYWESGEEMWKRVLKSG